MIKSYIKNYLIIKMDYSLPSEGDNLFSLQTIFKELAKYLTNKEIKKIQKGQLKLIFNFQDFWCTKTKNEGDEIINSGEFITFDIYGWLYPQLKKLNIIHNTVFISPLSLDNVKVYPEFKIVYLNEPFSRYIFKETGSPVLSKEDPVERYIPTQYNYKFLWLNRRVRPHRVYALYKLIEANLLNDESLFSFHWLMVEKPSKTFIEDTIEQFIGQNKCNIKILKELKENYSTAIFLKGEKIKIKKVSKTVHAGYIPKSGNFQNYKHLPTTKYWMEIVSETNYSNHKVFITEKIARPLVNQKPFIVFGDRYTLNELQNKGFKTFSNFWDESYDSLPTSKERIDAAVKVLKEIFQTYNWQSQLPKEMQEIVDFNYNHYYNEYKQQYKNAFNEIFT